MMTWSRCGNCYPHFSAAFLSSAELAHAGQSRSSVCCGTRVLPGGREMIRRRIVMQAEQPLERVAASGSRAPHACPYCASVMHGAIGAEYLSASDMRNI